MSNDQIYQPVINEDGINMVGIEASAGNVNLDSKTFDEIVAEYISCATLTVNASVTLIHANDSISRALAVLDSDNIDDDRRMELLRLHLRSAAHHCQSAKKDTEKFESPMHPDFRAKLDL